MSGETHDFALVRTMLSVMPKPEQPPEGALIQAALVRKRLSAREAAKIAGISEGRWRQIANGYQSAGGQHIPVVAPAATLAHMAKAVGVTPSDLTAAGRTDAADVLRDLLAARPADDAWSDPEDQAVRRVMESKLPLARKKRLVQMLLTERENAERDRLQRFEEMIDMLEREGNNNHT